MNDPLPPFSYAIISVYANTQWYMIINMWLVDCKKCKKNKRKNKKTKVMGNL